MRNTTITRNGVPFCHLLVSRYQPTQPCYYTILLLSRTDLLYPATCTNCTATKCSLCLSIWERFFLGVLTIWYDVIYFGNIKIMKYTSMKCFYRQLGTIQEQSDNLWKKQNFNGSNRQFLTKRFDFILKIF